MYFNTVGVDSSAELVALEGVTSEGLINMKRKILFVALFAFALTLLPVTQAQTAFPAVGVSFGYSITGEADWSAPLDVTIGFTATAIYQVTAVGTNDFDVSQSVSGSPIWPTSAGSGDVNFFDWSSSDFVTAASNTSFSFTSNGEVSTNNSMMSSVTGSDYTCVWLNWTDGVDEVIAYVGLQSALWLFVWFPIPLPTSFMSNGNPFYFYWNTSYTPWDMPAAAASGEWTAAPLATFAGVRNAYHNETDWSGAVTTTSGRTILDTWVDADTGLLLFLNDTTLIDNDGAFDCRMNTLITMTSCSIFAAPIPIVLIIAVVAVIIIIIVIFLLYWFVLRKRK